MAGDEQPDAAPFSSLLNLPLSSDLDRIGEQLHALARAQGSLQGLLQAVLGISSELELPAVLRRIVSTAMELVGARYGAMGVLDERGEELAEFIPLGLGTEELNALSGVELPRGRGLLGHLIHHPEPLRVSDISSHQESAGFPRGHPPMRRLLGVAISVRGQVYGNLYLTDRRDGAPFDEHDEGVIRALAGTAGVAIEHARLYQRVRASAETFQRLLLPKLLDLHPFRAATVYRPASEPDQLGGDWYDALLLPDGACVAVIGDVQGHDLRAAAAMSRTRSKLRALCLTLPASPGAVLSQLDTIMRTVGEELMTTACLARIEPAENAWRLRWSNAGHLPPLLLRPDGQARYLDAEPGVPLGVDPGVDRPEHVQALPWGATVLLYTDGLVERPSQSLDRGLDALARTVSEHAGESLDELCRAVVEAHAGEGLDDIALLALSTPAPTGYGQRD
ncbi:GAF domain-containing SpoIIE family protein phosphatase [Streptomyces sp. MP131-18]|uniref:PP2C family protein-serine/threonine phosphatase n=1 Tax=Streptomyces sp. MP131-18 TaxID=1857892 RepID=UPI0009C5B38D|nr:GAF domain-containing SpoIIE family protein phosphatase [Streptomyces sp. MP131-18]ONK12481.1 Hypoxia sensor histidine kinase response regulator DosT [Streptomyces sp. MP131-18]